MERKLIGDRLHVRVRCHNCGVKIWVNENRRLPSGVFFEECSDCNISLRHSRRPKMASSDRALATDIRYHGAS